MQPTRNKSNRDELDRDLEAIKFTLSERAQASSGSGFYFFVWGLATIGLAFLNLLPSSISGTVSLLITVVGWGLSLGWGMRQHSQLQAAGQRGNRSAFVFWVVILSGASLLTFALYQANGGIFLYTEYVIGMAAAFGLAVIGAFTDLRVTALGFCQFGALVALPAFFPPPTLISPASLLVGCNYLLAGWLFYSSGRQSERAASGTV